MLEEDRIEGEEESISLRDELANAFKEAKGKEPQVDEVNEEKKSAKSRDEGGKFKKEPKEVKEPDEPVEIAAEPAKVTNAPNSWTPVAKAKWAELPADIQAEVSRREAEVEKGFTKLDEERSAGKSFKEIVSPYMPMIQAEGGTPITAIKELLNTAYLLRTATPQAKGQMLMQLAQQFGADFSQVSQDQTHVDPQLRAIQSELAQLKNERQRDLTLREQQEQATIQSQITAFASDPKHIHFESVKPHMAALLKEGLAKDMDDAYEQAVYARPDIRSTVLQSQQAELEAKRVADAKAKADAARKASGSITGSPGATAPSNSNTPERTLREDIEAAFATSRNG